ncbi:hypothetical protein IW150_006309, partial [Coemansia sp. RSA 2607]
MKVTTSLAISMVLATLAVATTSNNADSTNNVVKIGGIGNKMGTLAKRRDSYNDNGGS